ncbi:MAG: acyloxyacyl hydrolase [Candidatus Binatia bacterium]
MKHLIQRSAATFALIAALLLGDWVGAESPSVLPAGSWRADPGREPLLNQDSERAAQGLKATDPFAAGNRTLVGYGSVSAGKSARKVYGGHLGVGYYVVDDLSLNVEGVGYVIEQANDTGGSGVNLVGRWHYWRREEWSVYADGGVGLVYTRDTLRDPGTHFNFTLQGGMGATYDLANGLIPMSGLRWFHISNARIRGKERNVGFDSPMFYLGLMMPF